MTINFQKKDIAILLVKIGFSVSYSKKIDDLMELIMVKINTDKLILKILEALKF